MTWFVFVLALAGLAIAFLVVNAVAMLLNRVLRPLRQIKREADEVLEYTQAISRNLEGGDEALRTRELVRRLAGVAER